MEYLAGYIADKYDVDVAASIPQANERIKNSTISAFQSTVMGYDAQTMDGRNTSTSIRVISAMPLCRFDLEHQLCRKEIYLCHERTDR